MFIQNDTCMKKCYYSVLCTLNFIVFLSVFFFGLGGGSRSSSLTGTSLYSEGTFADSSAAEDTNTVRKSICLPIHMYICIF